MAESAPPSVPSAGEVRGWLGWPVEDLEGGRVGRAQAIFADPGSGAATWLVVKQGRFGGPLVAVPLRDCAGGGGGVWVAHHREAIRMAPVVDPTRPLLREHELTICAHYGIGERVGRAAEVAARPPDSITSQPDAPVVGYP